MLCFIQNTARKKNKQFVLAAEFLAKPVGTQLTWHVKEVRGVIGLIDVDWKDKGHLVGHDP